MAGLTESYKNSILNDLFNATNDTWFALHTAYPATANEVSGGLYTRVQIAFGAASDGAVVNSGDFTVNLPSAAITHYALWDAETGGSPIWYGEFTETTRTSSGSTFTFLAGSITLSFRDII